MKLEWRYDPASGRSSPTNDTGQPCIRGKNPQGHMTKLCLRGTTLTRQEHFANATRQDLINMARELEAPEWTSR